MFGGFDRQIFSDRMEFRVLGLGLKNAKLNNDGLDLINLIIT